MAKVLTEQPSRFQITLCGVDWPRYLRSLVGLKKTPRMSLISDEINDSDNQAYTSEFLAQNLTLEKDEEKRCELVKEYVVLVLTEWAGISSGSEVDLNKSMYNYGIDSAAALTLKMQFEANLQVSFEVGCKNNRLLADCNRLQVTLGIVVVIVLYKIDEIQMLLFCQVFYFMQPDTTALKIANDVAARLSGEAPGEQLQNNVSLENGPAQAQPTLADASLSGVTSENQVQVVPLYTPTGAAITFFCVHPSHHYALNLAAISTGFQGQVIPN